MEQWKDIKGYENEYQISSKGRIKSLERIIVRKNGVVLPLKERIITLCPDRGGYLITSFRKKGIKYNIKTHRLVAKAFIPNPLNKRTVNHIDGDKTNNNVSNLEWATPKENSQHASKIGLVGKMYKFKENILDDYLNNGKHIKAISLKYNISREIIRNFLKEKQVYVYRKNV